MTALLEFLAGEAQVDLTTLGIISSLVVGICGALIAFRKVGPEVTQTIVTYQAEIAKQLRQENERLIERASGLEIREVELMRRIAELEAEKDSLADRVQALEQQWVRENPGVDLPKNDLG